MTRLNVNDARCVALFASELQRSDAPASGELAEAIGGMVRRFGLAGCASRMAQEFGDHPDAAISRMRWIRQLVTEAFAPPAARPGAWRPRRLWSAHPWRPWLARPGRSADQPGGLTRRSCWPVE